VQNLRLFSWSASASCAPLSTPGSVAEKNCGLHFLPTATHSAHHQLVGKISGRLRTFVLSSIMQKVQFKYSKSTKPRFAIYGTKKTCDLRKQEDQQYTETKRPAIYGNDPGKRMHALGTVFPVSRIDLVLSRRTPGIVVRYDALPTLRCICLTD